jgi:methylated-DNA-[protein]-cysteine S-methyltransferase
MGHSFKFRHFNTVLRGARVILIYCQKIDDVWYAVALENTRILATAFSQREEEVMESLLRHLPYNMPFTVAEKPNSFSVKVLKALKMIFEGKNFSFKFDVDMGYLSGYSQKVLRCASLVPIGYFTTYGAISKIVGGSPRAVGRALALNPFSLLIPCHRVVRSDFTVGGCWFGEKAKLEILERENRGYEEPMEMKVEGGILPVFPIKYLKR